MQTLRDVVAKRDPDAINPSSPGGVRGCPSDYGYLHDNANIIHCGLPGLELCARCWSRAYNPFADINKEIVELQAKIIALNKEIVELQAKIIALKEDFEDLYGTYKEGE